MHACRCGHTLCFGDVEVWHTALQCITTEGLATLNAREKTRAERFRRIDDRRRYLTTRCMLRDVLAHHLAMRPTDLEFTAGRHGKLELVGSQRQELRFNAAHSGDLCVLAVARAFEVGIDVERVRSVDAQALVRHLPRTAEVEPLATQTSLFFSRWVRMEACAKLHGTGLGSHERLLTPQGCSVQDFSLRPGYAAALAAPQAPRSVLVREWVAR